MTKLTAQSNLEPLGDFELRRCAIFAGLAKFMTGRELRKALQVWEEDFSDAPKYALREFIGRITKDTELSESAAIIQLELAQKLLIAGRTSHKDSVEAEPDLPAELNGEMVDMLRAAERSDATAACEALLKLLFAGIERLDQAALPDVLQHIVAVLPELDLSVLQKAQVKRWCLGRTTELVDGLHPDQLQQLVHAARLAVGEHCGAGNAEQLLAAAVVEAELCPHAVRFPISRLL